VKSTKDQLLKTAALNDIGFIFQQDGAQSPHYLHHNKKLSYRLETGRQQRISL